MTMASQALIVPVSDVVDVGAAELRARLIHCGAAASCIEPVAQVAVFSHANASFVLRLLIDAYPPKTVFLVVVNALKDRPARVAIQLANGSSIVGANTGALGWAAGFIGVVSALELSERKWVPFGGREILAPAAAHIALGCPFDALGDPIETESILDVPRANGTVVHVDNFGLIKLICDDNLQMGAYYWIRSSFTTVRAKCVSRMMSEPDGEWTIYRGSSFGLVEVGLVRGDAAAALRISPGDTLGVNLA
jgi:S-adenosylmethionine hydrolase